MSGNRFNRLPTNPFMAAFESAVQSGQAATNANMQQQINSLQQAVQDNHAAGADLTRNVRELASAIEQELLKMSHKISEDDSISVTDQLAWFMNAD